MNTILIIEDEPAIADNVIYALETEGYRVRAARLGTEGVEILRNEPVGLVILDIGLPDGDGFEFCRIIRSFSNVPVIFLTARGDEVDRVVGLEIGADDYVVKPFSPRELAARVKVVLRRVAGEPKAVPDHDFERDMDGHSVSFRGQALALTRSELMILNLLLDQPGRIYSRRQIMERVWDAPEMTQERAVDTHIKTLRAKIREVDPDRDPIRTHRGLGYSFAVRPS